MKYKAITDGNTILDLETTTFAGLEIGGEKKDVRLVPLSARFYEFIFEHQVYLVETTTLDDGNHALKINGQSVTVELKDELQLRLDKMSGGTKKKISSGDIKAPMPGLVVKIEVATGDIVKKGQGLMILEAMKMQNEIKSPVDGTVKAIKVSENQAVDKNLLLMTID
jgi:biotin carboxyl carrier protein